MVTAASLWPLRRAANRWPAAIRGEFLAEWTAEVRTIARSEDLSAFHRARLMLGFGVSLALSRPGGEPALGWKRVLGLVAAVVGYLLALAMAEQGWFAVAQTMGAGTGRAAWLVLFVLLASAVRRAARLSRTIWRLLAGTGITVLIAGLAVTTATFVQFPSSTAPRSEAWHWFALWLVPRRRSTCRPTRAGTISTPSG